MGCACYAESSRLILHLLLLLFLCEMLTAVIRRDDICGSYNGKMLYLELGGRGVLTGRNLTSGLIPRSSYDAHRVNTSHEQCSLELITCPSCVITITFRHLDLSHRCGGQDVAMDTSCRCDYVWVSEPPNEDKSGIPFCGVLNTAETTSPTGTLAYRSQTRTLSITLLYSENHNHAFTLEYSAERNRQFLKGASSGSLMFGNVSQGGILTSPFFPAPYPRDLSVEYVVNCQLETTSNCRVRLIFQDFLLATLSIMEFYDSNGNRMEVSSGGMFRPPVILSSGSSLMVRFYANGGTGLGYKAAYSFIGSKLKDNAFKPKTDCGGYVENLGGAITMMNMVDRGVQNYDCVWLIRPPKNFLHLKTHLYLKVASLTDMADSTDLKVLQGLTSDSHVIETIRYRVATIHQFRAKEHITPADVGFYVSLQGSFSSHSRLAIVYASFNYMDCYTGSDFLCNNHRCIAIQLHCDGFDHCGDNSDEPESCFHAWDVRTQDKVWYAHTPNYFFPKMERYPDLKTATMVFVASSLGMILLISALIVLLYHMGNRARHQRELQTRLQTISGFLGDSAHTNDSIMPDEPPIYEAPPDYNDIIKVFDNNKPSPIQRRRSKRHSSSRRDSTLASVHNKPEVSSAFTLINPSSPAIFSKSSLVPDTPPPPYMLDAEPSCSGARLSQQGARRRESWLLFQDTSSEEQDNYNNLATNEQLRRNFVEVQSPNIDNNPNIIDNNQNIQSILDSVEMDNSDTILSNSENQPNENVQTSFDTTNSSDLMLGDIEEQTILPSDELISHVKGLHEISLSLDSLISGNGLDRPNEQSTPSTSEALLCDCAGACGCASMQRGNQLCIGLPPSSAEGLDTTRLDENFHSFGLNLFLSHQNV